MRHVGCRRLARSEGVQSAPTAKQLCAALVDARQLASRTLGEHGSWTCSSVLDTTSIGPMSLRSPCTPSTSYSPPAYASWHHMNHGKRHYSTNVAMHGMASRPPGSDPPGSTASPQQVSTASVQVVQQQQEQQQATQQQQQSGRSSPVRYSPLHYNVEDFCQRVSPTEDERKYKQQVVELIRSHARKAMLDAGRRCDVMVFGSFATGLSTWSSDVDLVVTGVMEPDRHTGVYDVNDRGRVVGRLRRIGEALRRCKKLDSPRISIIPRARIPIIKLKVRNVMVDISMSDDTGPRVARFMAQQVHAYPPMRPLVLVLKAYLRSVGLNEVMHGGLSSYSLCNMVVAHLQEEIKAGRDIHDLGEVLYAFLLRYGEEFDYGRDAVSIESGGVVPKHALGMGGGERGGYGSHELDRYFERLAVDCPVTGRDVSNGTYRIDAVRASFQRAARRLEALARGRKVDDLSLNYLQALFDVNRMVKRTSTSDYEYEDDFIRVLGRGTGPDVIQLDRGRGDFDEEEVLGDSDTSDSLANAADGDERWSGSDEEGMPAPGGTGKGKNKGGPRGKGTR